MKSIIISILMVITLALPTVADPIINDGLIHDTKEIQRSMDRIPMDIAIGMGTGLLLMGTNHLLGLNEPNAGRHWYVDDSWFFLIPVCTVGYDVAHVGFHSVRIGVRIGKGI